MIWSAGLLPCDSEIHCMHNYPGRGKKTAALCWLWHAGPYLPTTFSHKSTGTDLLSAGSSAPHNLSPWHVLPGQLEQGAELLSYTLSCIAAPKAAPSWGRTDQKAVLWENSTVLKLKCLICNSSKIFGENILKMFESPHLCLSQECHRHAPLTPHQAKGRGVVWGGWGGEGREGHDLL